MKTFRCFEDVEQFLREWRSFTDDKVYDEGGILALFAACIDNMSGHLLDAELEELPHRLTESQIAFLLKLATYASRSRSDAP